MRRSNREATVGLDGVSHCSIQMSRHYSMWTCAAANCCYREQMQTNT